ncbi:MAG: DUF1840 domain-containing protein [Candidatus Accumulibacter phosphatis]|jgi:hypothetical protein|uniref:DUF1840 domain-containing protein n=1 Tax=Candidatus Accumulibacter contiguus TaxID=2954381 RepID=UPI001A527A9A|nr:DUF1840 domain-containing protein [Accumulibacter sp.]
MLVTFTSSTSGQIMMFAQVARQLLELVGKDCSARGVITTEQLPEAIQRLRAATADHKSHASAEAVDNDGGEEHDATPIGLGQRAYPLLELLEWTRKEDGFVLWEAAKDF